MSDLRKTVDRELRDLAAEAGQLAHAAEKPGQCTKAYVAEHAAHAREAIDKAEEACSILVREGSD